jgi:hypothetical protein
MKRSRTALALFLCTFIVSLSAVGFAEGESRPLSRSSGLQPDDLDQLDFGFSPSCSLGVPRGIAACESSVGSCGPSACAVSAEAFTAVSWIANAWSDFFASLSGAVARQISDCSSFIAASVREAESRSWSASDAELEAMCAEWIASEQVAAAQAASDSHFLYALSGAWRSKYEASIDCFDGFFAIERYLQHDDFCTVNLAADPRHSRGSYDAIILNESSQGLTSDADGDDEAGDEDAIVRFVAENFGPAYALAISRHVPVRERRYEGVWIGCDALPDASTAGWLDDASRAVTLQTWRAIVSPLADLAGQLAQGSQQVVNAVSGQIAGWLVERGTSLASELPPAKPSKAVAPRNANRSNEPFIIL